MQYYNAATMATPSEFHRHLEASQTFLRNRNFPCAKKSDLLAQNSDPNHPFPPRIIAISSILNAPPEDLYAILDLPPFTTEFPSINTNFQHLKSLLNSSLPFTSEAYGLVVKAWFILSDPVRKSRFDEGGESANSFWTICPNCYFVYEFVKLYEDCWLKCPNEECRKAFHGVPLDIGVVWNPFSGKEEEKGVEKLFIEISDDEETEDGVVNSGAGSEEKNVLERTVGDAGRKKVCRSRSKMTVSRSSRNLTGKGVRVGRDEVLPMKRMNVGSEDGGLEFNVREDDTFVL